MRRIITGVLALSLAFSFVLTQSQTAYANALAGGGYSSSYSGESDFLNLAAGGSGTFTARFFNDGTQSWAPSVVGLLVCLADKTTCNVASPNASYASNWFSSTVYATSFQNVTVPAGSIGFFAYNIVVPAGTAGSTVATFNGDLGLISGGTELRPEGYFQVNTTPAPAATTLTISPTSAAMPVGGQQQFTTSNAPAGSTVAWSVTGGCGAVTQSGLFVATATNSATQPCSVVASAGGQTASATITVFGSASTIACSATKTTIPADGGTSTTAVKGTLQDSNGNTVSNDNTTSISYTNNTPTILTPADNGKLVVVSNGVSSRTYASTTVPGTATISLSGTSASGTTLTGCSQTVTTTAPGAPTKLAASFSPATLSADGTSTSVLEVDVTDANGTIVVTGTGSTDTISVSETAGSTVCTLVGGGQSGSSAAAAGSAFFTMVSTTTPGTCSWAATDTTTTTVAAANATLTTVITGAANKLTVTGNTSPKAADGVATLKVTVALQDANGNTITTPASQTTVTSTFGSGCTGTFADGTAGAVAVASGTKTTSAGLAKFTYSSTWATSGCTVTFTDGTGVSSTSATIVFTAGGATGVTCLFSPKIIKNDGSSTSIGTASIVDAKKNLVTAGTFSMSFALLSSNAGNSPTGPVTTQSTSSPQNTTNGTANFTVKSTTGIGTDTYRASTSISGTSVNSGSQTPADCIIFVSPSF